MKNKVIISSILTIAMCLSMIAGSTFALFTSESQVNVAVTSGKVSVTAVAENLTLGSTLGANVAETSANFIEDTNEIKLVNFVPGDFVKFDLRIKNESTVTVNYRTVIQKVLDTGLFGGLNVTIGNETYGGNLKYSPWSTILPGSADVIVPVVISLPESAGVDYMAKSCTISYMVEAVQGNASLVEAPTNADQLQAAINAGVSEIVLLGDITSDTTIMIPEGKAVAIDLNGHTVTRTEATTTYAFANMGDLTLYDSTGTGEVNARGIYNGYDGVDAYNYDASLTIINGTYNALGTNGGAAVFNYGKATIQGGTFTSVFGYTLNNQSNGTMVVSNAYANNGIYNMGDLTVTDTTVECTISGRHAIYCGSGSIVINSGNFSNTSGNEVVNSGSNPVAIYGGTFTKIGSTAYLLGGSNMVIYGGVFNAHESNPEAHHIRNDVTIQGGVFNYNVAKHNKISAGYTVIENNGKWTVLPEGTTSVANDLFVNGDTYYATSTNGFNSAISNATAGQTVEVLSDVSAGGTQLALDKEITVDLNGHELTTSNNYGGMSIKNGASIKNGTINHTGNTAAIKVGGEVGAIENVVINMVPTEGKTKTGIQVYNGKYVESIKNVTITGATQGIEVAKGSRVDLIENVTVEADTVALIINAASVGKVVNCSLTGGKHGVHMMLNGEVHVSLELVGCTVKGGEAAIIAHDEAGISNVTNCSLTLTYDSATKLDGEFVWNFEDECLGVVTLNAPAAN